LSGRSKVVGGDAYELRIVAETGGKNLTPHAVEVSAADKSAGVKRRWCLTATSSAQELIRHPAVKFRGA